MPSFGKAKKMPLPSNEETQNKVQLKKKSEKMTINSLMLESQSTFGVNDELNLQMEESPSSISVQLPQIPQAIKDQIRGLKDENGRLFQLLKEKDFEIRHLQKFKTEHSSPLSTPGLTNETAAAKIVELSKKLRETVAEKESEKTKCKQLAKQCEDLKSQVPYSKEGQPRSAVDVNINSEEHKTTEEFKNLQDKLKQAESKMAEWRNQCQIFKQELKLANRVISQEVGENFNLHSFVSGKTTWKGRMQQIITLQQKISELKQQVEELQPKPENVSKDISTNERNNSNPALRRLAQERKEAQEKVIAELKELQEQHASLKSKFESSKARNQVLSNEVKVLKQQIQTLLDKGQHDDEMISTLMTQLSQMKEFFQENNQFNQQNLQQQQQQQKQQQQQQPKTVTKQNDEYVVEKLTCIIAQKDEQIKTLSENLRHLSGEMTPKGEIFHLAPIAEPNIDENSYENKVIREHFDSN